MDYEAEELVKTIVAEVHAENLRAEQRTREMLSGFLAQLVTYADLLQVQQQVTGLERRLSHLQQYVERDAA